MTCEREVWSRSMLAKASFMAGQGSTAYEIARKLNVSSRSVYRYSAKYEFTLQIGPDRKRPNTIEIEISDERMKRILGIATQRNRTINDLVLSLVTTLIDEGATLIDNVLDE